MSLKPNQYTVAQLIGKLDELSEEETEDLKAAELEGRSRKSLLDAIDEALEAHGQLDEKLDEIAEQQDIFEPPSDVLAGVTVTKSSLGWSASGGVAEGMPGFGGLNFGSEAACRNALAARVLASA